MNTKQIRGLFILLLFSALFTNVLPKTNAAGSISGFVYDAANGEALIGASVYIKSLVLGGVTNNSGYFVIPGVPDGEYKLSVSYIGYKTVEKQFAVQKGVKNNVRIELEPEAYNTGEIVVSGDSIRTIEKLFIKPVSKWNLPQNRLTKFQKW